MSNIYIIIFTACFIASVVLHIGTGIYIKTKLKKRNKYEEYKEFNNIYKKASSKVSFIGKYFIFIVPIINVLIALVEVINANKTFITILQGIENPEKILKLNDDEKDNEELQSMIDEIKAKKHGSQSKSLKKVDENDKENKLNKETNSNELLFDDSEIEELNKEMELQKAELERDKGLDVISKVSDLSEQLIDRS